MSPPAQLFGPEAGTKGWKPDPSCPNSLTTLCRSCCQHAVMQAPHGELLLTALLFGQHKVQTLQFPMQSVPCHWGAQLLQPYPKASKKKRLSLQESPPDLFIYHGLLSINTSCFKQKGTDGQLRSQPPAVLCGGEDAQTSFAPRAGKRQLPAVPSSATQTQGMRTNSSRNSNSAQNLPTSHGRKAQAVQPPRRAPTGVGLPMQSKYRSSGFAQFQMCAPAQSTDRHAAQADCSGARVSLSQCLCRAM